MKLAVVGCGAVAEYLHVPAALRVLGPENLWLVDADRDRALELADRFGGRGRVVEASELPGLVDAAVVATPNHLHAPVARRLLAAGVHVLCEKPLATSGREAAELVRDTPEGVVLAAAHFRRFFPSAQLVRDLLERRLFGKPLSFRAEEGSIYAWGARSAFWLDRAQAGGGVLIDIGPHVLDLLLFWLGQELDVRAYRDDARGGVETDCELELLAGGVRGSVALSRTRVLPGTIVVDCEQGSVTAPLTSAGPVQVQLGEHSYVLQIDRSSGSGDGGYGAAFEAQLRSFVAAVEHGAPPAVSGAEALGTAELIDRAYSIREPLEEPWVTETLGRV